VRAEHQGEDKSSYTFGLLDYLVGFGVVYGRGGVRLLGEHTIRASNDSAARKQAERMKAIHERILYVEPIVPPGFD
jgi:hypothetical protein